jgi:UDP-glucose:(heptosyl)LPS alpha-1,3-glucosyltransferase
MKGLGYLVKALAEIRKEDRRPFKLLVLGRDRQGPYLRLAKKMGISEEVVFAGSTGEPEKYYGAADLLVHPTFYDACSLTVLEALASGLPVITTSFNGASGVMTQSLGGFILSDPRDEKTLSQKISFFLNREVRGEVSIAVRKLAEYYSLEKNWIAMKDILEMSCQKLRGRVERSDPVS